MNTNTIKNTSSIVRSEIKYTKKERHKLCEYHRNPDNQGRLSFMCGKCHHFKKLYKNTNLFEYRIPRCDIVCDFQVSPEIKDKISRIYI